MQVKIKSKDKILLIKLQIMILFFIEKKIKLEFILMIILDISEINHNMKNFCMINKNIEISKETFLELFTHFINKNSMKITVKKTLD